jgi:biopolymer transport protein ExbB
MKKLANLVSILLCMACLFAASSAHATWNAEWTKRARLKLNTAADGLPIAAGVDGATVLVRLHTGNFQFIDAKPDGSDLRFIAADDKTPLKFHIEKFDGINELAFVWVQMPRINPGAKAETFWLYYGNPKAPPASDSKTTFDTAQGLVYHFAEGQSPHDGPAHGRWPDGRGRQL